MKRIISLILVSLLTLSVFFSLTSCGKVNKSEVSVLWSGEGEATDPNSLINAMDRAMYIKKVNHTNYGAEGNAKTQRDDAVKAINAGSQAIVIELVEGSEYAQEIVDAAKAKNVPVIFFNCTVSDEVVNSYNKCFTVQSDVNTIADVQGQLIADYVKKNFKDIDKDEDNKITVYVADDNTIYKSAVIKANEILNTEDYQVSRKLFGEKLNLTVEIGTNVEIIKSELILTADDEAAYNVLCQLQEKDYNTDKLKTQFVPIITVGTSYDYKSEVLKDRPAIPENLKIGENDSKKVINNKNKEIKKIEDLNKYYEKKMFLVDLTSVNESDLEAMIYTTTNVIDAGRIAGAVTEDLDTIALTVAAMVRNVCKGADIFTGIIPKVKEGEAQSVVIATNRHQIDVRFISYGN